MGAGAGEGSNSSRADGAEPVWVYGNRWRGYRSEAWCPHRLFATPVRLLGRKTACKEGITKMDTTVAIAGIDVSKHKLDVHVLPGNRTFTVSRDRRGLADLVRRLRKAGVGEVALEASGDYERIVIEELEAAGAVVHLLNPARVRLFAEAAGMLAKTDPIDARLIALYCQHFPDKGLTRRPENARKLAEFLTVRAMLHKIVDEARNRLEHLRDPDLRALAERTLCDARSQLKQIARGMAKVIAQDEVLAGKARIVRSLVGAGPVLAANLLAGVPELGTVGRRQAARLCGVSPTDDRSGKGRRRSRIDGGRQQLRPVLHMVALAAMRSNPVISDFANRLTANGKPKLLVIAACARKIIVILNAMLRDQTNWRHANAA
ncbi:MAG: IS110 family transposase [Alphaproteobacteria bacterium]|nr:IS110 family transposase [Alphaproteobacteria bacterium]